LLLYVTFNYKLTTPRFLWHQVTRLNAELQNVRNGTVLTSLKYKLD